MLQKWPTRSSNLLFPLPHTEVQTELLDVSEVVTRWFTCIAEWKERQIAVCEEFWICSANCLWLLSAYLPPLRHRRVTYCYHKTHSTHSFTGFCFPNRKYSHWKHEENKTKRSKTLSLFISFLCYCQAASNTVRSDRCWFGKKAVIVSNHFEELCRTSCIFQEKKSHC